MIVVDLLLKVFVLYRYLLELMFFLVQLLVVDISKLFESIGDAESQPLLFLSLLADFI